MKFKDLFPTWESFKQFIMDYRMYYDNTVFTDARILVYWSMLYKFYGNSHIAYDHEVFLDMISLELEEHFREFFMIRELLDFVASKDISELLIGMESVSNIAENPNIETDKNTILNYIGTQTRSRTQENIVDRVYSMLNKIRVKEIHNELLYYRDYFMRIIPRTCHWYPIEEEEDELD